MKKALSLLMTLVLLLALVPTTATAAGKTFTLMVYMCGTDLESDGGCATADLQEMVASGIKVNGNVTIYVQTGGTKKWATKGMTNREGERWSLDSSGMERVDNLGRVDMGDDATFTDFLQYGFANYPADRYGLVLWDHGAGASDGVCYDEISGNSLNMAEIYSALHTASKASNYHKFSFVGFDACLMANYEMALHLQPFADYMIASEETEPGDGWDYTSWLPVLVKDTSAKMEKVGKAIIDGFITSVNDAGYDEFGTLALIDLSQIDALRTAMEEMGTALLGQIDRGNFNALSRIRQNVRSFGETSDAASDMIDLSVFATMYAQYDATGAQALMDALNNAVVYSRYTDNLTDISGLSILVPYSTRDSASQYLAVYDTQNLMPKYTNFVRSLVSGMASGSYTFGSTEVTQQSVQDATVDWFSQYATDTQTYYDTYSNLWGDTGTTTTTTDSTNTTGSTTGDDFSLDSFLNTLFGSGTDSFNTESYATNNLWDTSTADTNSSTNSATFGNLWGDVAQTDTATVAVASGDQTYTVDNPFANTGSDYAYTVSLSDEDMQNLASAETNLMMDISDPDFECYVDLGYTQDVIIDWNQGKLYGLFDGTWPTLDGQMVCIYDQVANENYIRSLIPVSLNGQDTYLLVVFDESNPGGVVVGASEGYNDAGQPVRGYETIQAGDIVIPQYELIYWDENDEQQSEPFDGDPITVGKDGFIAFSYQAVETDASYVYGFCLNDVYGDSQFTDFITLDF